MCVGVSKVSLCCLFVAVACLLVVVFYDGCFSPHFLLVLFVGEGVPRPGRLKITLDGP